MKKLLLALLLPFSANALDPARLNSTFILAPASTLQASAGTASVISCTVSVAALQGTVDTPTAVTPTFLSSSVTPLYTSAAGVTSLISLIACANTSASQVTNLKIFAGNAATGCSTTASTQSAATAPVAVTNINTQAFLGAYFACSVASCATVQEVKYEYGQ